MPLIDLGTVRLPRLIGHSRAMDLILTGRGVPGDEALAFGLANRLVPDGSAHDAALDIAQQIAAHPQACLRNDRASALAQWGLREDEAAEVERAYGLATLRSGESVDGAAAFLAGQGRGGESR